MNLEAIKQAVGPKGWLEDESDTLKYRQDWRGRVVGDALLVIRPDSTAALSAAMRIAYESGLAVVPQGGNTGLVAGSVPTEDRPTIIVSTDRMTGVRDFDAVNFTVIAESGCIIQNLQDYTAERDRLFPLSIASEGSCTLGGTLSTNAGGNQTVRFGNAREQVLGLEAVLPDGTVFNGMNTLRKNNTGYDLKHLFIGGEGTLGVITAAAIRLMPLPRVRETAMLAVASPAAALELLNHARALSGDNVLAFELITRYNLDIALEYVPGVVDPLETRSDWYVLMDMATSSEIDDLSAKLERIVADAMEEGWVTDGVVASSEAQRAQLWRPREEQAEAGRHAGPSISCDISVPVSRVPNFLERSYQELHEILPSAVVNGFGHVGDGNIHFSVRKPADLGEQQWEQYKGPLMDQLLDLIVEFEGSFSAEHGIGSDKRTMLADYAGGPRLDVMKLIKQALDPKGLMNPGKVFL